MSSEGVQIEIPTFDDEGDSELFGGQNFGASAGFGGSSFLSSSLAGGGGLGLGSVGPSSAAFGQADTFSGSRSLPQGTASHTRGDSGTSNVSARSFQFGANHLRPGTGNSDVYNPSGGTVTPHINALSQSGSGFPRTPSKASLSGPYHASLHSASPSNVGTPSRKHSFASFKNAFKSNKSQAGAEPPPPLPTPESQPMEPPPRNPFNRSASALAQIPTTNRAKETRKAQREPPSVKSPSQSGPSRFISPGYTRARSNSQAASAHSHSSSIAHSEYSDYGENSTVLPIGHSVPPVSSVTDQYGNIRRHHAAPSNISELGGAAPAKPQKPHEFAIHVLFTNFVMCAERLVDQYLNYSLHAEPSLNDTLGPEFDAGSDFSGLLESLGQLARKHAQSIIDSVMRWKNLHREQPLDPIIVERHRVKAKDKRPEVIAFELTRRKELATIFIMCKSLASLMQAIPKDGLELRYGDQLESAFFEELTSDPHTKLLSTSANQRANADLYARILGEMATFRFISVADRFMGALQPLVTTQISRENSPRYENIVRALRYVKLKVYPSEAFDEGAELLESISRCFANAHGQGLKSAFAEILTILLQPVAKGAIHEVNHPLWAKAVEVMYPKANLMSKPRYWGVSYPLTVTILCVAPRDFFLRHWLQFIEANVNKLKDKPWRATVLDGFARIVWTYLFRSEEPASTATLKLDTVLRYLFPAKSRLNYSADDGHEALARTLQYIICRHVQYGRQALLDVMHESAINNLHSTPSLSTFADIIPLDRFAVGLRTVLLTLHCLEQDIAPPWPSIGEFLDPSLSENSHTPTIALGTAVLEKSGMQAFWDRFAPLVGRVLSISGGLVGAMLTNDPKYRLTKNLTYEEREDLVVKHHQNGAVSVVFHVQFIPAMDAMRFCIESLPRTFHPNSSLSDTLDLLIRCVVHVDPRIGDDAELALRRFAGSERYVRTLIQRMNRFLFAPNNPYRDLGPLQGPATQQERLISIWVYVVVAWANGLAQSNTQSLPTTLDKAARTESGTLLLEIEAGGLYLLSSSDQGNRVRALTALRAAPGILTTLSHAEMSTAQSRLSYVPIITIINSVTFNDICLPHQDLPVPDEDHLKLRKWQETSSLETVTRVAESQDEIDGRLWKIVLPSVLRACVDRSYRVLEMSREMVAASILRYHTLVSGMAQTQLKGPTATPRSPQTNRNASGPPSEYDAEVEQWKFWILFLCASTTEFLDAKSTPREHMRMTSDPPSPKDRLLTAKGLFRHLIPFLMVEEPRFRGGTIQALASIHPTTYGKLLEDLQSVAMHLHDDPKLQSTARGRLGRSGNRLHSAMMQVYRLTAHFARNPQCLKDQTILGRLVQFVRESGTSLGDYEGPVGVDVFKLRRYFCGAAEMFFLGLRESEEVNDMVPISTRLYLFRLCQEWCGYGMSPAQRRAYDEMLSNSAALTKDPAHRDHDSQALTVEGHKLSKAAGATMAALCSPHFFSVDSHGNAETTPNEKSYEPLQLQSTVDWLSAIYRDGTDGLKSTARQALRALLANGLKQAALIDEVFRKSFYSSDEPPENREYFTVLASIVVDDKIQELDLGEIICCGLSNLCCPRTSSRGLAFDLLEKVYLKNMRVSSKTFSQFESLVRAPEKSSYLEAQQSLSVALAEAFPELGAAMIAQYALRLPQTKCNHAIMLKSLQPWAEVCLLVSDGGGLSREGCTTLINMVALTVHFVDPQPLEIQLLWQKVAIRPFEYHATATVKFLIEQCQSRGSQDFLELSQRIVGGIARTDMGDSMYVELCSVIESIGERGIPSEPIESGHTISGDLFTANLNNLFSSRPKLFLSVGQVALVLVSDMIIYRPWDSQLQLPVLLHAIFTHIDHPNPTISRSMQQFLFRILWCWLPGYDELPDGSQSSRSSTKEKIKSLESSKGVLFWTSSETEGQSPPEVLRRITSLSMEVLSILSPLFPQLRQAWGETAVTWATQCPVTSISKRSVQILRAISPEPRLDMVAHLLQKLAWSISDSSRLLQSLSREIIITLRHIAEAPRLDTSLEPAMFWSATALLSTTVEIEFQLSLSFLAALLDRLDLDDDITLESLGCAQPSEWKGEDGVIQRLVCYGLRSSVTYEQSFDLLKRIAKMRVGSIVDGGGDRLLYMLTASLPWFLDTMENKTEDATLTDLAMDLSILANQYGRDGIQRVMVSYAKRKFRTKDDFLRQAVGCIREYFMGTHSTEVITILLGLLLNNTSWLRGRALQILKLIFGQAETRQPLILHGSELLMPLLHLLETKLGRQALEVLDEPLAVTGGPTPAQVVRMSTHMRGQVPAPQGHIFGVPLESGWCVPKPEVARDICRLNLLASFASIVPSGTHFEGELDTALPDEYEEDGRDEYGRQEHFGGTSVTDIVDALHELGDFFQAEPQEVTPVSQPSNVAERVAAILNRSMGPATGEAGKEQGGEVDIRTSYLSDWQNDSYGIPGTPNPAAILFSSPQTTMDSLDFQRNFAADSDGSDHEYDQDSMEDHEATARIPRSSSPRSSEDGTFGLEENAEPKRSRSFRRLGSRLFVNRNGRSEPRRA